MTEWILFLHIAHLPESSYVYSGSNNGLIIYAEKKHMQQIKALDSDEMKQLDILFLYDLACDAFITS